MKKYFLILFLVLGVIFSGCDFNKAKTNLDEFRVAVVETTSNKEKSKITYYDWELKEMDSFKYKYAEFGTHFSKPQYNKDQVYIVPKGLMKRHDTKKIVSIEKKTGKATEYPIDKGNIQCTAANEKYVYAGSNINFISYLSQYDKNKKIENVVSLEGEYLGLIALYNDLVFAFVEDASPDMPIESRLDVYNEKLEKINSIDLTEHGCSHTKYLIKNDKLIFSNAYTKNTTPGSSISILDLNTFEIVKIELDEEYPSDIIDASGAFEDNIVIAHTSEVLLEGTKLTLFNLKDNSKKIIDIKKPIMSIDIIDSLLIVLTKEDELCIYGIKDNFILTNSIKHVVEDGSYTSGIFVNKKVD